MGILEIFKVLMFMASLGFSLLTVTTYVSAIKNNMPHDPILNIAITTFLWTVFYLLGL